LSIVPSSAEGLDQLNVARHLLDSQIQGSLLLRQKQCLGGEDIEIRIHSRSVARNRKIAVFLRCIGCCLLLYQLLCEQPYAGFLRCFGNNAPQSQLDLFTNNQPVKQLPYKEGKSA
jgi:hypothetical protein